MNRRFLLFCLGLFLSLGLIVWAQSGGLEALVKAVQGLLQEKETGQFFLDLIPPEGKTVETSAPQRLPELGEGALPPGETLLSSIKAALPDKVATLEQGFLLPPKEPSPVGKEFQEEGED